LAQRGDGEHFIVQADDKFSAFVELERQVLTMTFYLESTHAGNWNQIVLGVHSSVPSRAMTEQRRLETVEEFKLPIAAIIGGKPEHITVAPRPRTSY
jgi:hypothetical protein